jgi:AcrR family transcriptional regulator
VPVSRLLEVTSRSDYSMTMTRSKVNNPNASDMSSRPARRRTGDETRVLILHAADAEFGEMGYQAATMARIAERAGVAVQTVYFNFRSKPLMLRELIFRSVMGYTAPQRPEDADWFTALLEESDGATALRAFAAGGTPIFRRASVASETARVAAPTNADVAEVHAEAERLRETQYERIAASLEQHAALRNGVDSRTAADILLTLASAQTYLQFTRLRGWSDARWSDWLGDALCRLLLR